MNTRRRFPPDVHPLFDVSKYDFHPIRTWEKYRRIPGGIQFSTVTTQGELLQVTLTFPSPEILRVRLSSKGSHETPSPMLVAERLRRVRLQVAESHDGLVLHTGPLTVWVQRDPWQLSVRDPQGKRIFQEQVNDKAFEDPIAFPLGFAVERSTSRISMYESFLLDHDEHLYGLGERFVAFDQRGQRAVLQVREAHGTNSTPLAYKPIPFFLSTRGYGMLVHTSYPVHVDLGASSAITGAVMVQGGPLDYFLFYGPSLKEILHRYTALTGRPSLPPKWSFGVWYSRCMYKSRREVETIVRRLRANGLPFDVIHIDPLWLKGRKRRDFDACDFLWDEEAFPNPKEMLQKFRGQGVKVSLWENPYFPMDSPLFREALEKGYFLRAPDGGPARPERGVPAAVVDFTNPEAREWYKSLHRPLLEQGVAVFKADYGEEVPQDAASSTGVRGEELHNLYPLLYAKTVFEVSKEFSPQPVIWARSAWVGSQRYPVHWSGDAQSKWEVLGWVLASGLSLGLSGFVFWSHDIGGFYGLKDPKLYIRWAQLGLLSSHARFHGTTPREPWHFGQSALKIVRGFSQLRYRLIPYLYSEAYRCTKLGLPLMRPLVLEYQDDPTVASIADEYLLGASLLVAPVLTEDDERAVYLPAGWWVDFWTGERLEGARWTRWRAPLERTPLFIRGDSILPLGPEMRFIGERPEDPLTLEVHVEVGAEFTLFDDEEGEIPMEAERDAQRFRWKCGATHRTHVLRIHRLSSWRNLQATGAVEVLDACVEGGTARVTVRASGAYALTFITP
jgi:alpha-D-xyloside xylohydrolase